MNLVMMLRMLVYMSLSMSSRIFTVSNALLTSSATVIVRVGGVFYLIVFYLIVAMVLFMLYNVVSVEWFNLHP